MNSSISQSYLTAADYSRFKQKPYCNFGAGRTVIPGVNDSKLGEDSPGPGQY